MRSMINAAPDQMSEVDAIAKAKDGDQTGMARLYELHRQRIYSLCLRHTNNVFDAEDLTQDIFIQVFRRIITFRGEAEFRTWLYKVALNTARLQARRQRRDRERIVADITDTALSSADSITHNPTHRIALTQALSTLTPIRRKTLLLHDIQGLNHREIASRMGVSVIASKSRLHRAHVAIRSMLGHNSSTIRPLSNGEISPTGLRYPVL